jgi:hypothetical protein
VVSDGQALLGRAEGSRSRIFNRRFARCAGALRFSQKTALAKLTACKKRKLLRQWRASSVFCCDARLHLRLKMVENARPAPFFEQ